MPKRGQSVGFTKPRSTSPQRQPAGSLDISLFTGISFKTSITLKASVNNIWTFSKYSGISPESVTGLGRDNSGGYPNARTWTVGVVLNL